MNPVVQVGDDVRTFAGFPFVDGDGPHGMGDLSVRCVDGVLISAWKPTESELATLMRGGLVVLSIMGTRQPPVSLTTWDPVLEQA